MSSPQNLTWKSSIWLSLLICYAPFSWVLFISENRILWVKMWPLLPGLPLIMMFQALIHGNTSQWIAFTTSSVVSFGILLGLFTLMSRVPRWRLLIGAFAAALTCFLSWVAYGLYRA